MASIVVMALLLSVMPFAKTMADEATTVHLKTADDWQAFAERVANGETALNAVMDNDIDLSDCQAMIGDSRPYEGTFDGNCHTLTVHYNCESITDCAPFAYVDGATIQNLIIKGEIVAKNEKWGVTIGGIVCIPEAESEKTTSILNCAVYAKLRSESKAMTSSIAGLVGRAQANITIDNCLYAGEISAANDGSSSYGKLTAATWPEYKYNISNTLLTGTSPERDDTEDITTNNVYEYEKNIDLRLPGDVATQVRYDQLTSGELAMLLNKNNGNPVWGQAIGKDASPVPFGEKVIAEQGGTDMGYRLPDGTNWRTLIYPKDIKADKGLRIYAVSGINGDNMLVLNELESGKIPANTPVILYKPRESTSETACYYFRRYSYRNEPPTTGFLRGVYAQTNAPLGSYVLPDGDGQANAAFYKVDDATSAIYPYTCYLVAEQGSGAQTISLPADPTGINKVQVGNALQLGDGKIYTIDGKQVSNMKKGTVYIVNGRKFIIK